MIFRWFVHFLTFITFVKLEQNVICLFRYLQGEFLTNYMDITKKEGSRRMLFLLEFMELVQNSWSIEIWKI